MLCLPVIKWIKIGTASLCTVMLAVPGVTLICALRVKSKCSSTLHKPTISGLVSNTMFCRKLHFRWLSSVCDWNKASKAFREKYYVMYDIQECLGCRTRYKDAPGLAVLVFPILTIKLEELDFVGRRFILNM